MLKKLPPLVEDGFLHEHPITTGSDIENRGYIRPEKAHTF